MKSSTYLHVVLTVIAAMLVLGQVREQRPMATLETPAYGNIPVAGDAQRQAMIKSLNAIEKKLDGIEATLASKTLKVQVTNFPKSK